MERFLIAMGGNQKESSINESRMFFVCTEEGGIPVTLSLSQKLRNHGKEIIMELKDYQLEIIERALSLLESNYDSYDLEHLMYSGLELESEIRLIREKIDKKLVNS